MRIGRVFQIIGHSIAVFLKAVKSNFQAFSVPAPILFRAVRNREQIDVFLRQDLQYNHNIASSAIP